ncbi:melatonin receptor type 1B-A-like [Ruditapes philippinarum]|uniref:melatonin receptor type 1B-A-like n=1 Tax=Ruditapes philippinarum TaxID=129788 RepID=UPI00295BDF2B|nr:melatonin receptor type 1B-A-like [Ruditapes philippinarum]
MTMLGSKSLEFVEEVIGCLSESVLSGLNTTISSTMQTICNETTMEKVEAYVRPLWEVDFVMALIYCCLVGVALSVGTVGNILILIVTAGTRTMNRVGRDFVINLALADLCVAAVADPMCILGVIKGEKWFQSRWILCELVASMCLTACFCAFLSLTLMSVNRYVFVCQNKWYQKIFRRPVCIALCMMCWISAFLFEFPNFIGWGGHYFDEKNQQCIWDRTASFSYTVFVSAGLIGGPLLLMGLCFILVFRKIWLTKKNVFSLDLEDPLRMRRVWQEALRSSRTLVIIFAAFVICWTPYAILTALDVNDTFSTEVHLFATMLAHLHSSLNFTIYMFTNKRFRQSVFSLFRCSLTTFTYRSSTDHDKTLETASSKSDRTVSELPRKYYINAALQPEKSLKNGFSDIGFVEKGNEDGTIYNDMMNEKNGINGTYGDVQKY